ncbi:MAG: hypothetical protein ACT452_02455 [Microthrixaceae bacterium]
MTDDFLDEMIAERTLMDPAFPVVLDAAIRRRQDDVKLVPDDAADPQ